MATILKNVLQFEALEIGEPVSLPHRLNVKEIPVTPKLGGADTEGFEVTADETNVTVTRTVNAPGDSVRIYVEYWHTIESVTPLIPPPGQLAGLVPFFFAASGNDVSPINVEDEGVPVPGAPHNTLNFTGTGVTATDAGGGVVNVDIPGNEFDIYDTFVFRPGGVQEGNVFTVWADLVAAITLVQGTRVVQFDDSIVTPCLIPGGSWNMTQVIWDGYVRPTFPPAQARPAVVFGDTVNPANDATFPGLRKIIGDLNIQSRNVTTAPIVVPSTGEIFEVGSATGGVALMNIGAAPFFDGRTNIGGGFPGGFGNSIVFRIQATFGTTGNAGFLSNTPMVDIGNTTAVVVPIFFPGSNIGTGAVVGTNAGAAIAPFLQGGATGYAQQNGFAGSIVRLNTPFTRQVMGAPSAIAIAALAINTVQPYTAAVTQPLPLIKSLGLTIGTSPNGSNGTLDTTGMLITLKAGLTGPVTVTPNVADTIDGLATPFIIPAGESRTFHSNGVSNWFVTGASGQPVYNNFVFRPGGVQSGNVYTSWADLMLAKARVSGYKTIQIDSALVTPAVIPAGTYDMVDTELVGYSSTGLARAQLSIGGVPSGGDVIFTGLVKIDGDIRIVNLNTVVAPVTLPGVAGASIFEVGMGPHGDYPFLVNSGPAPFFDCQALPANGAFAFRIHGSLGGTTRAIEFGASTGTCIPICFDGSMILAGMIAGAGGGILAPTIFGGAEFDRQSAWTGSIVFGSAPSTINLTRSYMFPGSLLQAAVVPSPIAFVAATGLVMGATLLLNTTAGAIAQPLPTIRAAAPAIGASISTAGVLNSTGLDVTIKNALGGNVINVTPAAGETIDGGAGPVVVPPGGSWTLRADGVSNWSIVAIGDPKPAAARLDPVVGVNVPVSQQSGQFASPGVYVAVGVYTISLNVLPYVPGAGHVIWTGNAFTPGHILTVQAGFGGGQATVGVRIVDPAGTPVEDSFFLHADFI